MHEPQTIKKSRAHNDEKKRSNTKKHLAVNLYLTRREFQIINVNRTDLCSCTRHATTVRLNKTEN